MNELIQDWNTIEVSTKSTSSIGIFTIQFHLHHNSTARSNDNFLKQFWYIVYLDKILKHTQTNSDFKKITSQSD